ncbi:MAG TPA: AAA family ATPase [Symbiobacteriaceae bacterium]|nr:AAA family ATPase [Symbiobacteriaceae bacterium]
MEVTIEELREGVAELERAVEAAVIGQTEVVRQVIIALVAGGHVLLEGVPGLGKTLLVRSLSEALGIAHARVQFTPDLMPADITGTNLLVEEGNGRAFRFMPGPLFTNLLLADEINRATPKTQAALLEAMQERQVTAGDATRPLPKPFFVLATQNPVEQEGTYPLPEAQLDRFFFKIQVPFPTASELGRILDLTLRPEPPKIEHVTRASSVVGATALVRSVPIASHLKALAVRLILCSHPDQPDAPSAVRQYVRFGCSPRALQSLVLAAQVRALLEGRLNVAAEDLEAVAKPAMRHRVGLNFEAGADGVTPDQIVEAIWAGAVALEGAAAR